MKARARGAGVLSSRTGSLPRFVRSVLLWLGGLALLPLAPLPALAQPELSIAKDTIRITVNGRGCHMGEDCSSGDILWFPSVTYELNGALPSGTQPWAEFTVPGKPPLRMDGSLDEVYGRENRWKISCGSESGPETALVFAGKVPPGTATFTLGLRNELMETNSVLFEGSFVHEKRLHNPSDETTAAYYVNDDWKLPIGYLYMSDRGLHVVTWYRGRPGGVKTYLFHNGAEVANNEACGIGDEHNFDPTMLMWWEVDCELIGVYGDSEAAANGYEPNFDLSSHPGEYEIKCLAAGKLARVVKFTVNPDGSFDNGIAAANHLGSDRVIVPVAIRMDNPAWDKAAWKTGAYYGHPLTGFVAAE